MEHGELLIAGLLVAVAGLSALARQLSVPYPIVLVVGGALLGFVPGLPEVALDPDVVLLVFLPPLLYGASIFANFNDLRANLRALSFNAVGLVLATMCLPCRGRRRRGRELLARRCWPELRLWGCWRVWRSDLRWGGSSPRSASARPTLS
jgi:hypothetical protein